MDDLADEYPPALGVPLLLSWEQWLAAIERGERPPAPAGLPGVPPGQGASLAGAVLEVIQTYGVPPRYLRLLVEGLRSDATRTAMSSFAELREYCFRVAGTVGLAMCYVLGATEPETRERAERLGIAMQLTNVLRDVGEDLARGRVYLPSEDLDRFGITRTRLAAKQVDARFVVLMRFQVARTRAYYAAGLPGVFLLPPDCRLPILLAGRLYSAILGRIEAQGYDVFTRRAATSSLDKAWAAAHTYAELRAARWVTPSEARAAGEMAGL